MNLRPLSLLGFGLALSFFFGGCAQTPEPNYYFGAYSKTLYHSKKTPSAETYARHEAELKSILETSAKKSLRPPPGIACEYAWDLVLDGKSDQANQYFAMEVANYPESAKFVAFLRQNAAKPATTAAR
jgi:hypothetical protein